MVCSLHVILCPHGFTASNAVCYDSIYPIIFHLVCVVKFYEIRLRPSEMTVSEQLQ